MTATEGRLAKFCNVRHARSLLVPPLRFGDAEQIEAVEFVELFESVRAILPNIPEDELERACKSCKGDGEVKHECSCGIIHWHDCSKCKGKGTVKEDIEMWTAGKLLWCLAKFR